MIDCSLIRVQGVPACCGGAGDIDRAPESVHAVLGKGVTCKALFGVAFGNTVKPLQVATRCPLLALFRSPFWSQKGETIVNYISIRNYKPLQKKNQRKRKSV